jgi:hypothetical protein
MLNDDMEPHHQQLAKHGHYYNAQRMTTYNGIRSRHVARYILTIPGLINRYSIEVSQFV